jgi:DNA-binding MarR family transcriptional regulator
VTRRPPPSGVTRLVDRLVEAGLVVRETSPSHRCTIHGVLTVAPIKIVGSDRSEDKRNRIHINKGIAHSPCSVR